jgi:transcriptional regulator GlxA family with amidase domain
MASGRSRAILRHCLAQADDAPTVERVAQALGVSRRSLHKWLARDRLPAPATILVWSRLIRAAVVADGGKLSLERIVLQLGFGSTATLRRCLWRHAQLRASVFRESPAAGKVAAALLEQWSRRQRVRVAIVA